MNWQLTIRFSATAQRMVREWADAVALQHGGPEGSVETYLQLFRNLMRNACGYPSGYRLLATKPATICSFPITDDRLAVYLVHDSVGTRLNFREIVVFDVLPSRSL